jgi:Protein of unknown function (DUF1553)/Protein of unknown function (DUF1549)
MSINHRVVCSIIVCTLCCLASLTRGTDPDVAESKRKIDNSEADQRTFEETPLSESDYDHWSFQSIVLPQIPVANSTAWSRSAIDRFIASKLAAAGIPPGVAAEKNVWLRRVKLDLLGLPPTTVELTEFASDVRPDAFERIVDRWLSSPRFGERWAQHWLDLARFAETDGFEHDKVREHAWQYRDWVVNALNSDMPYDEFIRLQIAGDYSPKAEDRIATMFCLAGADMPDLNDQEVRRHDRLNELTSTIGSALLGLQMQCAQCHDHKYDPISQADFFRLRAIFESAVPDLVRDKPYNVFESQTAQATRFYFRGELNQPGPVVLASFPRIAVGSVALPDRDCDVNQPRNSFATWLFRPSNPLTARVIVNRVWQHHFGRGLFENPSDVGVVPGGPSHPELLDWLAFELQQHRWSLKDLHRQIVLSATYRQASLRSASDPAWSTRLESDPQNELYSRFPRHRLDGETIRDSMLAVAGLLDLRAGGPGVMPPLPMELTSTLLKDQWKSSPTEADHVRRSIYIFARRNLRYPLFEVFDRPDAGASCPQRDRSTTSIQSLQMLNSYLSLRCAAALRERWREDSLPTANQPQDDVATLFLRVFSRNPTANEVRSFADFLSESNRDTETAACLALLNSSEFIYVD